MHSTHSTFRKLCTHIYRMPWRLALLLSLIPVFIVLSYFWRASAQFMRYQELVDPKMELTLDRLHFFLNSTVRRDLVRLGAPSVSRTSDIPTYYLTIDDKVWNKLNKDLPESGREKSYSAKVRVDNDPEEKIKIRYRGGNNIHWLNTQKSFRIKEESGNIYNLINPPFATSLIDVVSYDVASELGVLAPEARPVRVFLNGRYLGMYHYVEQTEENMLRRLRRMPGSIYFGDSNLRTEDKIPATWLREDAWTKEASRNADHEANRDDIILMTDAVRDYSDIDFYAFANQYMNKDAFYTYFALDVIFGTIHHDYWHNHKLYFDPYKGKFEPIEWDIRWWAHAHQKDLSVYPLLRRIQLNPVLEHERDSTAYKLMHGEVVNADTLFQRLEELTDVVYDDLASDLNRDTAEWQKVSFTWVARPYFMQEFLNGIAGYKDTLTKRQRYMDTIYEDAVVSRQVLPQRGGVSSIRIAASGNSATVVDFSKADATVYRDVNMNGLIDTSETALGGTTDIVYPGRKKIEAPIHKGGFSVEPSALHYAYLLRGGDAESTDRITYRNAVTDAQITPTESTEEIRGDRNPETASVHPWQLPQPQKTEITLQGTVSVRETRVFDSATSVTIVPGTTFVLSPGTSLFFYGRVSAEGTAEQPIRFTAADEQNPWGSVVLQGIGTAGSILRHISVTGGSVAERNLVEYTAPFSLHDVSDFTVSDCFIGPNAVGDDAMHIGYGNGTIERCVFYGALSDALDVDIAEVAISNSLFMNSGNDLLDFMSSDVSVTDSLFINGGDKCISTGEWTYAEYERNVLYGCTIGIEVKDLSEVTLTDVLIANPRTVSVNLYNKILLYEGGGIVTADTLYVTGNTAEITSDKASEVHIGTVINEFPPLTAFSYLSQWMKLEGNFDLLDSEVQRILLQYEAV